MAGKKHKHKQRRQQQGNSNELLSELSSLHDLLGTDDLGDIPLLDQVAEPAQAYSPRQAQPAPPVYQPVQEPLDESDLPVLFSPVDEELPEDISPELNEADRALLRPLEDLPSSPAADKAVTVDNSTKRKSAEQQTDLFDPPAPKPAENPFLPAHIRARLTGGKVPRDPEPAQQPAEAADLQPEPTLPTGPGTVSEQEEEAAVAEALRELEQEVAGKVAIDTPLDEEPQPPKPAQSTQAEQESALQRQKLVDRLVASQLPELERQLRARIELMLDELEAKR